MIPDEYEPIDFSWHRFIGMRCFYLKPKETMRLTAKEFLRLYQHYKNHFDFELSLLLTRTTYAQAATTAARNEDLF